MTDLSTRYLGLDLSNPLVASASPLSNSLDGMRRLEDAGVGAIVMFSLFEEQIIRESQALDHYLSYGSESYGEALTYLPDLASYHMGTESYIDLIQKARKALNIPVIASLNGVTSGGWIEYAVHMQDAGASAIELNLYYVATDPGQSGPDVEQQYLDTVRNIRSRLRIPVAVKLSPHFSSTAHMAQRLVDAGADALVMFNRFYQPDFDLTNLSVVPSLALSTEEDLRLPLRWVAILHGRVNTDFAITSGVHSHLGVIKCMMAGAKVAMMASALLKNGTEHAKRVLSDLNAWMEEFEYESITQMRGSMSQQNVADPAAFERANYTRILQSWKPALTGS